MLLIVCRTPFSWRLMEKNIGSPPAVNRSAPVSGWVAWMFDETRAARRAHRAVEP
jgi:hypothetical protein